MVAMAFFDAYSPPPLKTRMGRWFLRALCFVSIQGLLSSVFGS